MLRLMNAAHVDNTTPQLGRAWWPVALEHEVPKGEPVAVQLLGVHWVLARIGDGLVAFVDQCPHRLLPLSAGTLCGEVLQCAYHGWRFDRSGGCVAIPSQPPELPIASRARLQPAWGVAERYGVVWLAPEEPVADLPDLHEWDDPSYEVRLDDARRATAGAHQALDNGCDTSHFGFVHAGTFGGEAAAITREKSVERVGNTIHATYETAYRVTDDPAIDPNVAQVSLQTKEFVPGGCIMLRMSFPHDGSVFTILAAVQPERDGSTRFFRWWARNDIVGDEARWKACIEIELEVQREDLRALGAFRDHRLPLDLRREVHVGDDRMSVAYRRLLAELVNGA